MKKNSNIKRSKKVRRKLKFINTDRLRLSVYRSSKNISAQIIDDQNNKTLVSASSNEKNLTNKGKKADQSNTIAALLAKRALDKKITKVYFDRGSYKYHGRIKIFAEALRKNGLIF
tara:strand:- start:561 stop:908 length:348 start_codon:yes stop_codon:yes gene_type:complete